MHLSSPISKIKENKPWLLKSGNNPKENSNLKASRNTKNLNKTN